VEQYKKRHCKERRIVPHFSASESWTSETNMNVSAVTCAQMEMGRDSHGFCGRVPRAPSAEDTIWVVADGLSKTTHFITMKFKDPMYKLARLYIHNIVRLHGVPTAIISYHDPQFNWTF
jgi:hypothetical protein